MEAHTKLLIVAIVLAAVAAGFEPILANGQTICRMSQEGLMACKPAVSSQDPLPPSAACCSALEDADFQCLCSFKKSKLLPSLGIDPVLALQLPAKCNLAQSAHC